jgi:serine/threonine-protein kinase ATR
MCFLPYVRGAGLPVFTLPARENHQGIMETLISTFLVRGLEDSTTVLHHDHAASSIQFLLERLGCSGDDSTSNEKFQRFSPDVQSIIAPFRKSRYRESSITDRSLESPIKFNPRKPDSWISEFTLTLLRASVDVDGCPDFFQLCAPVIPDSPVLYKFLLPYVFSFTAQDPKVGEFIRCEWSTLLELFRSEYRDFAKAALQTFFAVFDSLNDWEISPGTARRRPSWALLGVADDEQLWRTAFHCDLHVRALFHLEFHIRDLGVDWRKFERDLSSIYAHLDDPDTQSVLRCGVWRTSKEALEVEEWRSLSPGATLSTRKESLQMLLRCGRYERAFADAQELRRTVLHDRYLDAVAASAAVRLGRWDEVSRLCFAAPESVEIAVARLLLLQRRGSRNDADRAMAAVHAHLQESFLTAAGTSYEQLIPILAQFRLLEEIIASPALPVPWERELPLGATDMERIVAVRCALVSDVGFVINEWLQLARFIRKSGDPALSKAFGARARLLMKPSTGGAWALEMAHAYWDLHQYDNATALLNSITDETFRGKVCFLRAKWAQATQSAAPEAIAKDYAEAASRLPNSGKMFFAIASFADQRIMIRLQNNEIVNHESGLTMSSRFWGASSQPGPTASFLQEQIPFAIKNYLKALLLSYAAQEIVPRLLVLFFDLGKHLIPNAKSEDKNPFSSFRSLQKEPIFREMRKEFATANNVHPSVWASAVTQLISRVDLPDSLDKCLFLLIKYAFAEHPHSVLWHLMSVHHSLREQRRPKFNEIWAFISNNFLNTQVQPLSALKTQFQDVTQDLIKLAVLELPGPLKASDVCPDLCHTLKNSKLMIPRVTTFTRYSSTHPTISGVEDNICVLLSAAQPKKVTFLGSNGIRQHYLCKKDEDLRKDMRLMEFVSFVNHILSQDRQCCQRYLSVITFAVICLNECCAMIEWVSETCQLRKIIENLITEAGKGLPFSDIEKFLFNGMGPTPHFVRKRLDNFVSKILPAYPPVLHLWFFSHFKVITRWFETRLRYTRSVAVWSVVGYVLGLGDRHAENILISQETGACLHVDFSCLFDRAKGLRVPETVPFRLTQNIVDGMGVLKTEGVFTASAKLVLETLRIKKQRVIAVLTTFISDPLLEWKHSDEKQTTVHAKMTLMEIEDRLTGWTEDRSAIESPECMIEQLIKTATSNEALSKMFIGWQAWL